MEKFKKIFSTNYKYNATANARVNLIGEHTDYTGGYVLPMLLKYNEVFEDLETFHIFGSCVVNQHLSQIYLTGNFLNQLCSLRPILFTILLVDFPPYIVYTIQFFY